MTPEPATTSSSNEIGRPAGAAPAEVAGRTWEVVVVGAGLAGAVAAYGLARAGSQVLLLDRTTFPRWKVCGCCLNPHAQSALAAVGLGGLPDRLGAVPLPKMLLASRGVQARLELPGWVSLSRQRLDTALVLAAQQEGAVFVQGVQARLGTVTAEGRTVWLRPETGAEMKLSARLILAADGLGGRFLAGGTAEGERPVAVAADSRIGAGVVLEQGPEFYAPKTIYMAHGQGGYVGLVRLEDGRLNIAAAFDAQFLRCCHSPGVAARRMIAEVGWPAVPGLAEQRWRGTPPLTRRPLQPGGERVLALGDAAGYVEPFTGEGMAWALASGAAIVPLVRRAAPWCPGLVEEWAHLHRRIVTRRQWVCWGMAWLTRHPSLTRAVVAALDHLPWLATPFVRQIGAAPALPVTAWDGMPSHVVI